MVACRWISTIVALPVLMYTSWVLYERSEYCFFFKLFVVLEMVSQSVLMMFDTSVWKPAAEAPE